MSEQFRVEAGVISDLAPAFAHEADALGPVLDSWPRERVAYEIQAASRNRLPTPPGKPANYWQGVSPSGMRIGGFRDTTGGIKTAFPILRD